jgi:hypothetical protein
MDCIMFNSRFTKRGFVGLPMIALALLILVGMIAGCSERTPPNPPSVGLFIKNPASDYIKLEAFQWDRTDGGYIGTEDLNLTSLPTLERDGRIIFYHVPIDYSGVMLGRNVKHRTPDKQLSSGIDANPLTVEVEDERLYSVRLENEPGGFYAIVYKDGSFSYRAWFFQIKGEPAKSVETTKSQYTVVGVVKERWPQGNTYLGLNVKTADGENVPVWCTDGKTEVYEANKKVFWDNMAIGRKIGIIGGWEEDVEAGDGSKYLSATKIDLLEN